MERILIYRVNDTNSKHPLDIIFIFIIINIASLVYQKENFNIQLCSDMTSSLQIWQDPLYIVSFFNYWDF